MWLSDRDIIDHQQKFTIIKEGWKEENVNPASYDLTIGNTILVECGSFTGYLEIDLSPYSKDNPYYLMPRSFILAHTAEVIYLPPFLGASLSLKSSRAREGYAHLLAGHIDPGWYGKLTFELYNARQSTALPLFPGLKLAQLVFTPMSSSVRKDYSVTGRYYGATTVESSKHERAQ